MHLDKIYYIITFLSIAFRVGANIADKGGMYTREMPCFAIGCLYAMFYDNINAFFNKFFWPSFIVLFITFQLGFFLYEPIGAYASVYS